MNKILPLFLFFALAYSQVVDLPYVKITGIDGGSNVERFLGIAYNHPNSFQRFTEGIPIDESKIPAGSSFSANVTGKICPQKDGQNMAEDCLNLDIARPSGTTSSSKLPVMVWIYGGGFQNGNIGIYNPVSMLSYSVGLGLPYVYVAMNYRLNGFGFLSGKEAANAGILNLGLKDQRLALKWVQKYISYFGGDPTKVTIFGESAGAISVSLHLTAYAATKETNLFRAAISQSGSANSLVVPDVAHLQAGYDSVVQQARCNGSVDTLTCLKQVDFNTLSQIIFNTNLPTLALLTGPFVPTLDGDLIPDVPFRLIKQGKFVKVPYLAGEVLDEGTLFVFVFTWTSEALVRYAVNGSFPGLSSSSLDTILSLYPNNATLGSPYNTDTRTYYGAQGKRAASIYGDFFFVHPRRYQSEWISSYGVPTWNYRFDYNYLPGSVDTAGYAGVAHASDIYSVYRQYGANPSSNSMPAYWAAFATNLDPNVGLTGFPTWNPFNNNTRQQMRFEQSAPAMSPDDYRREASNFYNSVIEQLYGFPTPPSLLPSSTSDNISTKSLVTTSPSERTLFSTIMFVSILFLII